MWASYDPVIRRQIERKAAQEAASKVLHDSKNSKAAKTAAGLALTQSYE